MACVYRRPAIILREIRGLTGVRLPREAKCGFQGGQSSAVRAETNGHTDALRETDDVVMASPLAATRLSLVRRQATGEGPPPVGLLYQPTVVGQDDGEEVVEVVRHAAGGRHEALPGLGGAQSRRSRVLSRLLSLWLPSFRALCALRASSLVASDYLDSPSRPAAKSVPVQWRGRTGGSGPPNPHVVA